MARPTRRQLVAAAVVLALLAGAVIGVVAATTGSTAPTSSTGPTTSVPVVTTPTTTVAPAAADVAAARACEAFTVYLVDAERGRVPATAGRALADDASALLRGVHRAGSSGGGASRWSGLASDVLAAAEDVVHHDPTALRTDGAKAGAQCREVPEAAAVAGGFQR